MPDTTSEARGTVRNVSARAHGVYVIIAAIVIGLLGWFALGLFAPIAAEHMDELPRSVRLCLNQRGWMPLTAVPAFICGLLLLSAPRRSCLLIVLSLLAMLPPFAIIFYCFISILAPWYQMQSL